MTSGKDLIMESRLDVLATRLERCRTHGNRVTLEWVLESARILSEAKAIAGKRFPRWLKESGHMARQTARRHLQVFDLVRKSGSSMSKLATVGITKLYALASLDFVLARRVLEGQIRFSSPIAEMSDVQFRKEFRDLFPSAPPRSTREHVFRAAAGALTRAEKALHKAGVFAQRLTPLQKSKILRKVEALGRLMENLRGVA